MDETVGNAEAIVEVMRELAVGEVRALKRPAAGDALLIELPEGRKIADLKPLMDNWLPAPERIEGTATLQTLGAFIDHANRFGGDCSALFGHREMASPSLTAIYDYHSGPGDAEEATAEDWQPRFCRHRAHYPMPLSPEWRAWSKADGQSMKQAAFAAFIEDNLKDVIVVGEGEAPSEAVTLLRDQLGLVFASPGRLVELSRGLKARIKAEVVNEVTLASGEGQLVYATEHQGADGTPLKVPGAFAIAIPVFDEGESYVLCGRLRYRLLEGQVTWAVELYRPDVIFREAFDRAAAEAAERTQLPLFLGSPES